MYPSTSYNYKYYLFIAGILRNVSLVGKGYRWWTKKMDSWFRPWQVSWTCGDTSFQSHQSFWNPRFNVEVNEMTLKRITMRATTWPLHMQICIHVEIWPVGKKLIFYSNIESGGWGWKSPHRVLFLIIFGFGSHFVHHNLCYHNFLHTDSKSEFWP